MEGAEKERFFNELGALLTRGTDADQELLDNILVRLRGMPEPERNELLIAFLRRVALNLDPGDTSGIEDEVSVVLRGPDGEIKQTIGKGKADD